MKLEFLHLWPLTGLAGLALLVWWHRQSIAPLSPARARWSFAIRSAILLLIVLALAEPQWIGSRREQAVIWLVDVSRSLSLAAGERAGTFARQAAETNAPIAQSGFIAFAGKPGLVKPGETLETVVPKTLEDDATDLVSAIRFAEASIPAGYARTIVLFSDGQETRGKARDELSRLRASGVRIFTVPVPPPDFPEVLVRSISAPTQAADGEPFKLTVEIVSNRETEATLDLFRNGPKIATRTLNLKKGINRVETTQSVGGEKVFEFSATVTAKEDTVADNNHASAFVRCEGRSKALLIADRPEAASYLARALRQEGILLDIRPVAGAPMEMGDLQNYDLLVIDNVPATDLTPRQMQLYANYVRDFGGGLLMLGGEKSFGLGGYYRTPVEEVLPVRCDFEKEEENPSLGLVLVMDRSGSMSGEKIEMAKEAAKAAVELLSPRDYAGVVAFDNEAFWVAEIESTSEKGGILQKIASIEASGGTNMAPGLEMALERLDGIPAKLKHIIVMSDGMSTEGPFYELARRMSERGITLTSVGVGGDADQEMLKNLAEWGNGRFYFTDNAQSIPQIFARETMSASKSAIHDIPFVPVPTRPADFLSGIDFSTAPFLLGYVTTKAKPTSEVWLATEKNDPLLATWRFGLGQVGAFTSDARNRWAVEWLPWEGYGKFWAQLFRKLTRAAMLKHYPTQLARGGDWFVFSVDCADEEGRPLSDLNGELIVLDPEGKTARHPLRLTTPGRLSARWPATRGAHHTQLLLQRGEEIVDRQSLSAASGYPDEFLLRPLDEAGLRAIARETGGKYDPHPADLLNDRDAPVERELWPWLAASALFLFIADVATRRWPDSRSRRSAPAPAASPPAPHPPPATHA